MDVVLGVAVTGPVARLAMIGSPGGQVFDEYALDLPGDDVTTDLADTIVGTYRAVTESGNRLSATRLYFPDAAQADTLRQVLLSAGVEDVEVVSETEAATALVRSADGDTALLLVDDETATLTTVDADGMSTSVLASVPIGAAGAAVACAAVLEGMPAQADAPLRVMLVGHRDDLESVASAVREQSSVPVELPTDASFAIARGAAQTAAWAAVDPAGPATQLAPATAPEGLATQMAPVSAPATQMAPATPAPDGATALGPAAGPQLAYSMADPDPLADYGDEPYEMPMDPINDLIPEQDPDATEYTTVVQPVRQRMVLMGSAIGVPRRQLRHAGRHGRDQRPAHGVGHRDCGTARAVRHGAGALPASGSARTRSGGPAGRRADPATAGPFARAGPAEDQPAHQQRARHQQCACRAGAPAASSRGAAVATAAAPTSPPRSCRRSSRFRSRRS